MCKCLEFRLTFQCIRVGREVTSGNSSKSKSPSRLLLPLSPVEVRVSLLPKRAMPGRLIMLLLVRRKVPSVSLPNAVTISAGLPFDFLEGNRLGRRAAGI